VNHAIAGPLSSLARDFLGHSPPWYKRTVLGFFLLNPLLFMLHGYVAGWALIVEFILRSPWHCAAIPSLLGDCSHSKRWPLA
jgi:NhaB family Na+:H+ antiporter